MRPTDGEERAYAKAQLLHQPHFDSSSLVLRPQCRDNRRNGSGEPFPLRGLVRERTASLAGERVVLRAAAVLAFAPFGRDPALMFELVQRWIQRSLADLQDPVRHLL